MLPDIPPEAAAHLARGEFIEAIKVTRQRTGVGLKEAKDAVEAYMARHPGTSSTYRTAVASQRGGLGWVAIVALAIAGLAAYFLLR